MIMKLLSRGLIVGALLIVVPFWMVGKQEENNRSAATTYFRSRTDEGQQKHQQNNINVGLKNPSSRKKKKKDPPSTSLQATNKVAVTFPTQQRQPPQEEEEAQQQQPINMEENWRGAPIGDGEDTIDSYHSYDHRPPDNNDERDIILKQYKVYPCPNNGVGTMVSGQDPRYYEIDTPDKYNYKERNAKFICDVHKLVDSPQQPCVVYSFGSWDEISFEVGMNTATDNRCHIHTFDPIKPPSPETASRNHFISHRLGIGNADNEEGTIQKLSTIMKTLGHSHIHVLKIDVEGHEKESLPNIVQEGILQHVDQLSIEFHNNSVMKEGLDLLVGAGFGIVYARREDRCAWCTEVTMVKILNIDFND